MCIRDRYIIEQLKNSSFEIAGSEVEFKEGSDYPPIQISLDNGQIVEIIGKIDRMDIAKEGEEKYLRISITNLLLKILI